MPNVHQPSTQLNPAVLVGGLLIIVPVIALLVTPLYAFAVLPILALLFLFFFWRYPHIAFLLIIFFIPFNAYRALSEAYPALTATKLLGVWVVLVILVSTLRNKQALFRVRSVIWIWCFGLFAAAAVAAFFSAYPLTAFDNLRQLAVAFLFVALTMIFAGDPDMFKNRLPRVALAGILIGSLLAILGYIFKWEMFAAYAGPRNTAELRAFGAASDPNLFSAMAIFGLPLGVHFLVRGRDIKGRLAALALIAIIIGAVVVTFSRGGLLVLAAVMLMTLACYFKHLRARHLGFFGLIMLGMLIAAAVAIPGSYWSRQRTVLDTRDVSISSRISYIEVAWKAFKEHPVLGSGPGTFRDVYAETMYGRARALRGGTARRYAHNAYLEILVGTGAIGFMLFAMILIYAWHSFRMALQRARAAGDQKMASLIRAYSLGFASLLIYSLILSAPYHKFLWLSIGLSQAAVWLTRYPVAEKNATA